MPVDVPVTLTPWFDAKDNPPEEERPVPTDLGVLAHFDRIWYDKARWYITDPQPSVWCDPSPPDMSDPLTVEDLRLVLRYAESALVKAPHREPFLTDSEAIARLRRALDSLERNTD